ncbi:MAG: histidine kinase, partial [Bacteroidota bacterium]
ILEDTIPRVQKDQFGVPFRMVDCTTDPSGDLWMRTWNSIIQFSAKNRYQEVQRWSLDPFATFLVRPGSFKVTDQHIFLGSGAGFFRTALHELVPFNVHPTTIIQAVAINRQDVPVKTRYRLPHDQNALAFTYSFANNNKSQVEMRHRLIGQDTNWEESVHRKVQYINLEPGDYEFQLETRYYGEIWGNRRSIPFHIAKPIWETWGFRGAMAGAILLLIWASIRWWMNNFKKRTLLETEKLKAEQKALRAQLNPHFLFNAMTSIQQLVYNNDKVFAISNMARYAKLMRKVLNHSEREWITLSAELETLDLYIQLEALRFEGKLDYALEVDPNVDPEQHHLPPMLLQPFVENAIKHGLLNRKTPGGRLRLRFAIEGQALRCTIEDNGIGRAKARELQANRSSLHQSFSTRATDQRIATMNLQHQQKIRITVTDLTDANNQPTGTQMEVYLTIEERT